MMNWNQLISTRRLGKGPAVKEEDLYNRTQFQRDYDRIIFSSPFRRMQNKTQVFPLPGSIFVHNRLTHSLEVASVGRSLGNILSEKLIQSGEKSPLLYELGAVVSAGCLAHDMGNPPFGHAGEEAISNYFREGNGKTLEMLVSPEEWSDFLYFDGNANALRLLGHQFEGRREGGFALTYTTLASIVKYPFESVGVSKPKFGFFQSEKNLYHDIARELGIIQLESNPMKFVRHPLVFLVEAADDICYQIMDLEDAHKLKILDYKTTKQLFLNFYDEQRDKHLFDKIEKTFKVVTDQNERIAYLRAGVINKLVHECIRVFEEQQAAILEGTFQSALITQVGGSSKMAMEEIGPLSVKKIYRDRSVVEIEMAGYRILGTLLDEFITAVLSPKAGLSRRLLSLMPLQYRGDHQTSYEKIQSVIDFVSGMTDLYALDLYRKIKGINLPVIG
ncbi:deoxyguanosinetriphosphate triphosphohydrolase [Gaoshiqia sediminis]|uniref:Deoxyguanosinetriphosphate triphosphohydrolase n=1 Tax=Gaoshiqia sediminis TaxID=2986998 RepID=A0AA41Y9I2_9BACT|nr:deoxyguanosinetriphosphate triphosphohydrolase [Gaoshiqia sediminis]MCW0484410.1 deoxyguanosinetriphosphate triphosphohydrolase [Gaoshiqia sediminis]